MDDSDDDDTGGLWNRRYAEMSATDSQLVSGGVRFHSIGFSFNQPQLCFFATWNADGVTIANASTVGTQPNTVFLTLNSSM